MILNVLVGVIIFSLIALVSYFLGIGYLIDRYTREQDDKS
jgi:hypothetical protein